MTYERTAYTACSADTRVPSHSTTAHRPVAPPDFGAPQRGFGYGACGDPPDPPPSRAVGGGRTSSGCSPVPLASSRCGRLPSCRPASHRRMDVRRRPSSGHGTPRRCSPHGRPRGHVVLHASSHCSRQPVRGVTASSVIALSRRTASRLRGGGSLVRWRGAVSVPRCWPNRWSRPSTRGRSRSCSGRLAFHVVWVLVSTALVLISGSRAGHVDVALRGRFGPVAVLIGSCRCSCCSWLSRSTGRHLRGLPGFGQLRRGLLALPAPHRRSRLPGDARPGGTRRFGP